MSKLVEVQVELLDEDCLSCPIILLESDTRMADLVGDSKYVVHRCSHLDFCEQIYRQHINKENK